MKKTIIIISVVAVFLVTAVLLGIFVIPFYRVPAPLTLWEKKQLEEKYTWARNWPPAWKDLNDTRDCIYYFGEYNGYYILSFTYDVEWIWGEIVGDYEFEYGTRSISALKNGYGLYGYYMLSDLYEKGELTDKDIAKIYEYYLETKNPE